MRAQHEFMASHEHEPAPEMHVCPPDLHQIDGFPREFSLEELSYATGGFHPANIIGRGNFGIVYRGTLSTARSGSGPGDHHVRQLQVAVKRVSRVLWPDKYEFITKASLMTTFRHPSLVPLLGWCYHPDQSLVVYLHMPFGDLQALLHKSPTVLDWSRRVQTLRQVAAGLAYMHEEWTQVAVHRDVKSANLMFDGHMNARLGDFGLAFLSDIDKGNERFSGNAGTWGYAAPEMLREGAVSSATPACDVFSFGVLALELATGRKPTGEVEGKASLLVDWVWDIYRRSPTRLTDAADPKLAGKFDADELQQVVLVGLACANPEMEARPSIRQAMALLQRRWEDGTFPEIHVTEPSTTTLAQTMLLANTRFCGRSESWSN